MKQKMGILFILMGTLSGCVQFPVQKNSTVISSQSAGASSENVSIVEGDTALIIASRQGNLAQVKALLANGVDVNARNTQESTALMVASKAGHVAVIKELAKNPHLDIEATDWNFDTALMMAVQNQQLEAVKALLDIGADANFMKAGMSVLIAASYKGNAPIVQALLEAGANADWTDENGETALDVAVNNNHPAVVAVLYQHQAKKQK